MATKVTETFGTRVRALREARALSRDALARELTVSKATVAKWEKGETSPSLDNATHVAEYFGVEVAHLIGADAPDVSKGLEAARQLLDDLSPAFAAIKQAVEAATQKKGTSDV